MSGVPTATSTSPTVNAAAMGRGDCSRHGPLTGFPTDMIQGRESGRTTTVRARPMTMVLALWARARHGHAVNR